MTPGAATWTGPGAIYRGPRTWRTVAPFEIEPEAMDFEALAEALQALANAARLEVLWALRVPARAAEVELRPRRHDDYSPDRLAARQTVHTHLTRLERAGVVRRIEPAEGEPSRWVTNVPRLFALAEEMRKLATIPPAASVEPDRTSAALPSAAGAPHRGPALVVIGGPWEGRTFALAGAGPWAIGRSRGAVVALTYDPFVSAAQASIAQTDAGTFALVDDAGARNRARVNLQPLVPGGLAPLAHGDVLTVGRSHLHFRER